MSDVLETVNKNIQEVEEDIEKMYDETFVETREGEIIEGEILKIDTDGVTVSIGQKNDGFIPINQLSFRKFNSPDEIIKIGDRVSVYVINAEDDEGRLILSRKRCELEEAWLKVTQAHKDQTIITATAIEHVKGGLIVDLGLRGFVPASQIGLKPIKNLDDFLGEQLRLKVIDLDRTRRKVVLSQKKVLQEEKVNKKEKTLDAIKEGQLISGTVVRITKFGVFVDLGGVDGLVHISELAWSRVKDPSEIVKVGEEVEVMVLAVSKKKDRISLSLKQAKPDPWQLYIDDYNTGEIVEGVVTTKAPKNIFVKLRDGIEGIVPLFEISEDKNFDLSTIEGGQNITVKIIKVDKGARRITLSVKQAKADNENKENIAFQQSQGNDSVTLGDYLSMKK